MNAVRERLGRWAGVRRAPADSWARYQAVVEPVLAATLRVHRFAAVPVLGDPGLPLADVATCDVEAPEGLMAALAAARAPWVLVTRPGDVPAPLAFERLGQAAALAPDAAVITCDEDELDAAGRRHSPHVRPGPSPDRWLALDDSGSALLVNREAAFTELPVVTPGPGWRHELALRLAGPDSARHAHVPLVLWHRRRPAEPALSPKRVERVLADWGTSVRVTEARSGVRRVEWPLPGEPSVEVIVCFRDRPELLERCTSSLLANTDYARLSLALVDNGSVESETAALVARLAGHPRVRVLCDERPFNFAALNNAAVAGSIADVVVLLNNDTEVKDPNWLPPLLAEVVRPQVGAVAPLLSYPDGTVQHAGAALGLHGYAGHPFAGLAPETPTPFGRADEGTRNWLAVSAACLAVERAKFAAAGGFDERFVVAGNDVDLCLRLTAAGHRSLCVPRSRLVHDESRSRGTHIDPGDFAASERSYGAFRTIGDPFYNPNLTLERTDCSVRSA